MERKDMDRNERDMPRRRTAGWRDQRPQRIAKLAARSQCFNNLSRTLAASAEEAGFWPVISSPSVCT